MKRLPPLSKKSPFRTPKNTFQKDTQDFGIFNPNIQLLEKSEREFENAKEQFIKIKDEVKVKRKELQSLRGDYNINKTKLLYTIEIIEKILDISKEKDTYHQEIQTFLKEESKQSNENKNLGDCLKSHNIELNKMLSKKTNEVEELKTTEKVTKYSKMNKTLIENKEELSEYREKNFQIQMEYRQVEYQIGKYIELKSRLSKEIYKNKNKYENHRKTVERLIKKNEDFEEKNDTSKFETKKRNYEKRIEELKKELDSLNEKQVNKERTIENQKTQIEKIDKANAKMEEKCKEIEEEINMYETNQEKKEIEIKGKIEALENKISKEKEAKNKLLLEKENIQLEVEKKNSDKNNLEAELDKTESRYKALVETLKEEKEKNSKLYLEYNKNEETIKEMEEEYMKLKKKFEKLY